MKIDPEFRKLIPPLATEEREQLEANLVAHGCRDPLVLWRGTLIDGHNRYEICERLKIKYRTLEIVLASREHVLLWIEENQLGRRNLTGDQRAEIGRAVHKRRVALAKKERAQAGGKSTPRIGRKEVSFPVTVTGKLTHDRSRESLPAIAKQAGVSEHKMRQIAVIEKKMPEALPVIRAGQKTILEVKRAINEQEREVKREANRKLLAAPEATKPTITLGTYAAVVIDPPWDWGDEGDNDQFGRARPTYNTMSIEQIAALPVAKVAAANAHLYLWITNRSLPKGFQLLEQWGFRYVTLLTWCKPSIGMGNYFRGSTEHVLFGVRGSLPLLVRDQGTHFTAARSGPHSTKPAAFYELVERCSQGPWLEMFARQQRKGWASWGAEVGGVA